MNNQSDLNPANAKPSHDKAGTQSGSAATVTDAGIGSIALLGSFSVYSNNLVLWAKKEGGKTIVQSIHLSDEEIHELNLTVSEFLQKVYVSQLRKRYEDLGLSPLPDAQSIS
jgi:hypothetical protein